MGIREITDKVQTRDLNFRFIESENEFDTLEFSVSSEAPVKRWFYTEILEHSKDAIDFSRIRSGGMNLLFNHDPDKPIAVVEKANLDEKEKKLRVKVRFSKRPFAQEILSDIRDGILSNVSIGYSIEKYEERGSEDSEDYTIVVTLWLPVEISIAPVPADYKVGIGRGLHNPKENMEEPKQNATAVSAPSPHPEVTIEEAKRAAQQAERERIASITALCGRHSFSDLAVEFIGAGTSIEDARARLLDKIAERSKQEPLAVAASVTSVGMDNKEKKRYSVLRALNALATGDYRSASLERELSDEIARRSGRSTQGFYVPIGELTVRAPYTVLDNNIGAQALVPTVLREQDFIEYLREEMLMPKLGATVLNDLQGLIDIPKQTGGSSGFWTDGSEFHPVTETNATFGKISLSPKTVGAKSRISRYFMLQTSMDAENFVRRELARGIAEAVDLAALYGAGNSTTPMGIFNLPGVQSIVLGANGGALTWARLVEMETMVAQALVASTGSFRFLMPPRVKGRLKISEQPENRIWLDGMTGTATVNGYEAIVSTYLRSNRTKGTGTNLCDVVFGAFNNLIVGNWGQLELLANPYGAGEFDSGSLAVRALMTMDLNHRYPASYVLISDCDPNL